MKTWIGVLLIVIGAALFVGGLLEAYAFFRFNLAFFEVTLWKHTVLFTFIALIGLVTMIWSARKLFGSSR